MVVTALVMSAFISYGSIPTIVKVAKIKNLYAYTNNRTFHTGTVPNLGGIALFLGFTITTTILAGKYFNYELTYILTGLVIMFFIGIKDDILILDPGRRLSHR